MTKIIRLKDTLVGFAQESQGGTYERTAFGTTGVPIDVSLNNAYTQEYKKGFGIYTDLQPNPYIQDFNALGFNLSLFNNYLYQVGMPPYLSLQEYQEDSMVNFGGDIYISNADNNINNEPGLISTATYNLSSTNNYDSSTGGSFIASLNNDYYVYDDDFGNTMVLMKYNPVTKIYDEISRQDVFSFGYTPEFESSAGMSQSCRLTDNLFLVSGKGITGFSGRTLIVIDVNLNTGLFTLKKKIEIYGGAGAGSPVMVHEMVNLNPSSKLRFTVHSASLPLAFFDYDPVLQTIVNNSSISFAGDFGTDFSGSLVLNEAENKIAIIFADGGPGIASGGIGIYQMVGDVITSVPGSWDDTFITNSAFRIKRFSDNKIMLVDTNASPQKVKTYNLDGNGLTFTHEVDTTIGDRASNLILALVPVNDNKSFMISNGDQDQIWVYSDTSIANAWRKLSSNDLFFDGVGTSLMSNNPQGAVLEVLTTILHIGYVLKTMSTDNPAAIFGFGTWEKIEAVINVGFKSSDTDFNTIGSIAGDANKVIPRDGWGVIQVGGVLPEPSTAGRLVTGSGLNETAEDKESLAHAANNKTVNNLPPYFVVNMWKRTA